MENESEERLNGAQRELEAALRQLSAAPTSAIDPLNCAFEAGQHIGRKRVTMWRTVGLMSAIVAVSSWMYRPTTQASHPAEAGYTVASIDGQRDAAIAEQSVLRLRDVVLDRGLDALPRASELSGKSMTVGNAL